MGSHHLLAERAFVYEPPSDTDQTPANCRYDESLGAWWWHDEVLVKSHNPSAPHPQTKKHDRETGEDQKGE